MPQQIIPLFPATGVDAAKIQDFSVSTVDPIDGQALMYSAATRQWEPRTVDVAAVAGLPSDLAGKEKRGTAIAMALIFG